MQTITHFKNSQRSLWAEEKLRDELTDLDRFAPILGPIRADIEREPDGSYNVHLEVTSPKSLGTFVNAHAKDLNSAINEGVRKFKKTMLKRQHKKRGRERHGLRLLPSPVEKPEEETDAEVVLKYENARKEFVRHMLETPANEEHETDRKEKVLQGISGLGPVRIQKLLKRYPDRSLNDIRAAAWNHDIQNIPGFGQKLERDLIKALTVNAFSETGKEPNLPRLPFF